MSVFVARQPIFGAEGEVFGYELLFRSGPENVFTGGDGEECTRAVVANSACEIGIDEITDGKKAFINFPESLLLNGFVETIPPHLLIVEILEEVQPTPEVLDACRELRAKGYTLAMDDFVEHHSNSPLIKVADIIKVDFRATTPASRSDMAKRLAAPKRRLLAEKVEDQDEYDSGKQAGYDLFQGFFFAKPEMKSSQTIEGNKLAYLRLLEQINRPDARIEELEQTISADVSLTYKLMRMINSAWFGFKREICSIRHALVLLGPNEVRKWASLATLNILAEGKPSELIARAMIRARVCERLAWLTHLDDRSSELFLLGMFSLIDAIMDAPMQQIMDKLPLSADIKAVLLGGDNDLRALFDSMLCYETGSWERFDFYADALSIDQEAVSQTYMDSLKWVRQFLAVA